MSVLDRLTREDLIELAMLNDGQLFAKMPVDYVALHPDAKEPYQATPGAAGYDMFMTEWSLVKNEKASKLYGTDIHYPDLTRYHTGIAMEIPFGYVGLLLPRSSCYKVAMTLSNCVGAIDSDYRGEVCFIYRDTGDEEGEYKVGERIGQIIIVRKKSIQWNRKEKLSETIRGIGGFGSTGR